MSNISNLKISIKRRIQKRLHIINENIKFELGNSVPGILKKSAYATVALEFTIAKRIDGFILFLWHFYNYLR